MTSARTEPYCLAHALAYAAMGLPVLALRAEMALRIHGLPLSET